MSQAKDMRLAALRRFALAISILNILGHTVFGFEQSWAQPLVALATAYGTELLLEVVNAWTQRRRLKFAGGPGKLVTFLLPAHISGLAVAMLLYANDRLWPIVFATAVAIASKVLFKAPVGQGSRHFFNPSNFGISVTLLLFSWVGIAPPYHFTENLDRIGDWLLPAIIILSGSFLNSKFTHRIPLIIAWLSGFALQALVRSFLFDTPVIAALLPMSGMAFILYTFYMVTDPATTPNGTWGPDRIWSKRGARLRIANDVAHCFWTVLRVNDCLRPPWKRPLHTRMGNGPTQEPQCGPRCFD